jgi:Na+-driven multidrug efflux pump
MLNVSIMLVLGSMLVVSAPYVVAIFGVPEGSALADLAIDWIRLIGIGTLPVAIHLARAGVLNGAGATRTSLKITLSSIVIQLPLAALLAFHFGFGAHGIWIALLSSYVIRAVMAEIAYRRTTWAVVGVTATPK